MTTRQPEQEPAGQPEPGAVENPPETQIIILSNQLKELEQDYKHKTDALFERVADLERLDGRLDNLQSQFQTFQQSIDARFDNLHRDVNARFDAVHPRFDDFRRDINTRFDNFHRDIEARFDNSRRNRHGSLFRRDPRYHKQLLIAVIGAGVTITVTLIAGIISGLIAITNLIQNLPQ